MKQFVRVSSDEWRIDGNGRTTSILHSGPEYEDVVQLAASTAVVLEHRRERLRGRPSHGRLVVKFAIDKDLVNLFHNGATGYRAQYYASSEIGDEANALMVRSLAIRVEALLSGRSKRTCPLEWLKFSMNQRSAKVWIHQGLWLRNARRSDERLRVDRWFRHRHDENVKARRRARWAALLPASEGSLELKGAFVSEQGAVIESLKPSRACDLHEYGFT